MADQVDMAKEWLRKTTKMQLGEMQDYWVSVKMYGSRNFFTFSRNDSFFFGGSGGTIKKL